jgi:hypothetical protein
VEHVVYEVDVLIGALFAFAFARSQVNGDAATLPDAGATTSPGAGDATTDGAAMSDAPTNDGGSVTVWGPQFFNTPDPDSAVPFVDTCANDDGRITVLARGYRGPAPVGDDDFVYFGESKCDSERGSRLPPHRRRVRTGVVMLLAGAFWMLLRARTLAHDLARDLQDKRWTHHQC